MINTWKYYKQANKSKSCIKWQLILNKLDQFDDIWICRAYKQLMLCKC